MSFEKCQMCGEYGYFKTEHLNHKCHPKWECRLESKYEEDDDEWKTIYAFDEKIAAEKFAEKWDSDSYPLASGRYHSDFIVRVRKPWQEEIKRFLITAESVAHYYGKELHDDDAALTD